MDFLQRFLGKPKGLAPVGNITLSELDINPRTCSFQLVDIQNLCHGGSHEDLELQEKYQQRTESASLQWSLPPKSEMFLIAANSNVSLRPRRRTSEVSLSKDSDNSVEIFLSLLQH